MMKTMKQFWVIYHKRLFITITTSSLTSNFKDIAICELQMYLQDDEARSFIEILLSEQSEIKVLGALHGSEIYIDRSIKLSIV